MAAKKTYQYFNKFLGVTTSQFNNTGALNGIVGIDSPLSIDPFLETSTQIKEFQNAEAKISNHLKKVFTLLLNS